MAGRKGQTFGDKEEKGWTLFNAGALGSELALVKSIFETIGTPNEKIWPVSKLSISISPSYLPVLTFVTPKETAHLPDWDKMTFVQFPGKTWEEILPSVEAEGRDLVGKLVRYQSTERMKAEEVSLIGNGSARGWLADDGSGGVGVKACIFERGRDMRVLDKVEVWDGLSRTER